MNFIVIANIVILFSNWLYPLCMFSATLLNFLLVVRLFHLIVLDLLDR